MSNPSVSTSPRYFALDCVRAAAMLLGVLYHAIMFVGRGEDSLVASRIMEWAHSFRMPLFFLISGFFGHMMLGKYGLRGYLMRRWSRIGPPLFCALVAYAAIHQIDGPGRPPRPEPEPGRAGNRPPPPLRPEAPSLAQSGLSGTARRTCCSRGRSDPSRAVRGPIEARPAQAEAARRPGAPADRGAGTASWQIGCSGDTRGSSSWVHSGSSGTLSSSSRSPRPCPGFWGGSLFYLRPRRPTGSVGAPSAGAWLPSSWAWRPLPPFWPRPSLPAGRLAGRREFPQPSPIS